jgi:lysyl-tRNA synthetase class 2
MADQPTANQPITNEFEDRKRKLGELRAAGIQPYPERFNPTYTASQARVVADRKPPRPLEEILKKPAAKIKLAGRLMLLRPHGKLTFAQLRDSSGQMQVCFMNDFLAAHGKGVDPYKLVKKLDMGDFIGVKGELFVTRHGELTLLVKEWELLGKTLRPLPEKFHGLKDIEARYRYRYLDLLADPESKKRFLMRAGLISSMRRFLDGTGFTGPRPSLFSHTTQRWTLTCIFASPPKHI